MLSQGLYAHGTAPTSQGCLTMRRSCGFQPHGRFGRTSAGAYIFLGNVAPCSGAKGSQLGLLQAPAFRRGVTDCDIPPDFV